MAHDTDVTSSTDNTADKQLHPAVIRYLNALTEGRRYSAHTLNGYRHELTRFQSLIDCDLLKAKPHHITGFVTQLHRLELAPKSIQRALSAVRSLYNFLFQEGKLIAV